MKVYGRNIGFYNTLYQMQQVDSEKERRFTGKNTKRTSRVPNHASVPLNERTKLELSEICNTLVPIQPRVQRESHEQKLPAEEEMQASKPSVPIHSEVTVEKEVIKLTRTFKQLFKITSQV